MLVREGSDYRSIAWVTMAICLVTIQYCRPSTIPYLFPISCYLAIACGTIAHNHSHRPMFKSRRLNNGFGHLLTIFYGYPTLMWIPTHNLNHHRFVNRPGDATATWRYGNRHNLIAALAYPFVSAYFQSFPINKYIREAKEKKPSLYSRIRFQYMFWILTNLGMLGLAAYLYHRVQFGMGLYVWTFTLLLPALCSSTMIMIFNYIQHVHTDAWSEHDHSRNFTGKWFNFLFFNNGYHTAHHENPGLHWSNLEKEHDAISAQINPSLNEPNLLWFVIRQYAISLFIPSMGTKQLRAAPDSAPET